MLTEHQGPDLLQLLNINKKIKRKCQVSFKIFLVFCCDFYTVDFVRELCL